MYLKSRKCIGLCCLIELVSAVMCSSIFRSFARSEFPRAVRFSFIWAGIGYGTPTVGRVFVDFLSVPTEKKFRDINYNFGPQHPSPSFFFTTYNFMFTQSYTTSLRSYK